MSTRNRAPLVALTVVTAAGFVLAAPAAAATARFSCRASAIRAVLASPPTTFEPTAAGGGSCSDASASSHAPSTAAGITVGVAGAFIHAQRRDEAPGGGALASLTDVAITGAGDQVVIGAAQAQASNACAAGSLISASSSQVTGVLVNGKAVSLSNPDEELEVSLDSNGSYVLLNDSIETASSLTRVAALVHLVGVGDFAIAEALIVHRSSPCAGTRGFRPAVQPCPLGSVYEPSSQACLITAYSARPIHVTAPFGAPTGGSVYSISHARTLFHKSHCLTGRGPRYVVVGAPAGGGLIRGTAGRDRILAVGGNYTIEGEGGADCIAVNGGIDTIHDGNARIRVFGGAASDTISLGNGNDVIALGPGYNRVKVGNGNDRITGGLGVDRISAGNGDDYVHLGPGVNRITVGNGDDAIFAGPGFDQIRVGNGKDGIHAGAGIDEITAGTGNDYIQGGLGYDKISARGPGALVHCGAVRDAVVVNPAAVAFARHHGCTNVVAG